MKLLLTSTGIKNKSISDALLKLIGKPFSETKLAFVPTAANDERGDKRWVIEDLGNISKLGLKSIDIIDISALPKEKWVKGFKEVDILFFEGGNTFYLMYWIEKFGLNDLFFVLLKYKIYLRAIAGRCVTCPIV